MDKDTTQHVLHQLPQRFLVAGSPINYDLRSRNNVLLIKRGSVIRDVDQINAILKTGPCVNAEDAFRLGIIDTLDAPSNILVSAQTKIHVDKKETRPFDVIAECITKTQILYTQNGFFAQRVESISAEIIKISESCPEAVAAAVFLIPFKSYTAAHAVHCGIYSVIVGRELGLQTAEIEALVQASLLMNISQSKLQDKLFNHNQPITPYIRTQLDQHPQQSASHAKENGIEDPVVLRIVEQHHEKPDGSGYPRKLVENKIHKLAIILHILDVALAKITHRSYRKPMAPKKALGTLLVSYKDQYCQEIIKYLIKAVGVYPSGTIVKLASGETAVITNKSHQHLEMWSVFNPSGLAYVTPLRRRIELNKQHELQVVPYTDINKIVNLNILFGYG